MRLGIKEVIQTLEEIEEINLILSKQEMRTNQSALNTVRARLDLEDQRIDEILKRARKNIRKKTLNNLLYKKYTTLYKT